MLPEKRTDCPDTDRATDRAPINVTKRIIYPTRTLCKNAANLDQLLIVTKSYRLARRVRSISADRATPVEYSLRWPLPIPVSGTFTKGCTVSETAGVSCRRYPTEKFPTPSRWRFWLRTVSSHGSLPASGG